MADVVFYGSLSLIAVGSAAWLLYDFLFLAGHRAADADLAPLLAAMAPIPEWLRTIGRHEQDDWPVHPAPIVRLGEQRTATLGAHHLPLTSIPTLDPRRLPSFVSYRRAKVDAPRLATQTAIRRTLRPAPPRLRRAV